VAEGQKVVAIGPREEMMGLAMAGIELVAAETPAELVQELPRQAAREDVCLVLLSESVAAEARELVSELRRRTGTVIMLLPAHEGARGVTAQWLKAAMEQSIGVDVISER